MAGATGTPVKVFISYRRDDSAPYAGRLYDRLADAIGQENIFMDVDSISFGLDFADAIGTAVSSCDVLLAIIGPEWLTISDRDRRRLDDPDDFVRLEIEAALERNVRVVPVLVDEAELPARADLPESLQPLVRRQTLRLSHDQFRLETQRLLDDLTRLSGGSAPPGPAAGAAVAAPLLPPVVAPAAGPTAPLPAPAPTVSVIVAQGKLLTLSVQLAAQHVIEIDNTSFFGIIRVDGEPVVKKVNPEGAHTLILDDHDTPIAATLSFGTTWGAKLKDVVLRIGDQVIYQSDSS
jgi:TIR domain